MAKPKSEIDQLRELGMSNDEIKAVILAKTRPAPAEPPQGLAHTVAASQSLTAPQRMDRANLGPDPEIVARHREAVANAPKAVLEETFEVTLERRYVDYVRQFAALVSAKRPQSPPCTEAKAIDLIIRAYRQVDPDRALMEGARGRTAPKALPPAEWAQKTA
jgi:hypothetical protein